MTPKTVVCFERRNKSNKPLARLKPEKKERRFRPPVSGIREVTLLEIVVIFKDNKEYYKKLYANKSDNLSEMNKSLKSKNCERSGRNR